MNGNSGHLPHDAGVARDLWMRHLHVSSREAEVLWWVIQEMSNDEISTRLGVSALTVKTHLQNLCKRLGCHSKVGLAVRGTAIVYEKLGEPPGPVEDAPERLVARQI